MGRGVFRVLGAITLALAVGTSAFAQATTSLSGVVKDSTGGVLPGATVVVKENSTGATFEAVTSTTGAYRVPALQAGVYTVTATLTGFKTAVNSSGRCSVEEYGPRATTIFGGNQTRGVDAVATG